ncbi:MAG: hypothetical protein ACOY3I_10340 [Verrucomicrobiota bacterium]
MKRFFYGAIICACMASFLPAAPPEMAKAIHLNSSVMVFDSDLAEQVSIITQDSRRDANQIFIARTILKNNTNENVEAQVRTFFKNTQGVTVGSSPVKPLHFRPYQEQTYISVSAKKEIDKFVVYLKPYEAEVAHLPTFLLLEVQKEEERY